MSLCPGIYTVLLCPQTVQSLLGDQHVWCMDELFPIFQFVVVRAKIRHLGAEISMIDDLMERHMELGELGIMFTMLKVKLNLLLFLEAVWFVCLPSLL